MAACAVRGDYLGRADAVKPAAANKWETFDHYMKGTNSAAGIAAECTARRVHSVWSLEAGCGGTREVELHRAQAAPPASSDRRWRAGGEGGARPRPRPRWLQVPASPCMGPQEELAKQKARALRSTRRSERLWAEKPRFSAPRVKQAGRAAVARNMRAAHRIQQPRRRM